MNASKAGSFILVAYVLLIACGFLMLVGTFVAEPLKRDETAHAEARMLEYCAETLAMAMDKNADVTHSHPVEFYELTEAISSAGDRVLNFPTDGQLGEVFTSPPNKNIFACQWRKIGEARGRKKIGKTDYVRILVYPGAQDLSALRNLQSNDVQVLDCSRTPFVSEDFKDIAHLSGLLILNLNYCKIDDAVAPYLANIDTPTYIDLSHSKITDQTIQRLKKAPPYLFVGSQNVKGIGFGRLKETLSLALDRSAVSIEGLREIASLPYLADLYLNDTNITDADLKLLAKTPKLVALGLNNTKVTGPGLAALSKLRRIELERCNVNDSSVGGLKGRNDLLVLNLGATKITDAAIDVILSCPNLTELNLNDTKITDKGVEKLNALKDLKQLSLPPQISDQAITRFKSRHPECHVIQHYS